MATMQTGDVDMHEAGMEMILFQIFLLYGCIGFLSNGIFQPDAL